MGGGGVVAKNKQNTTISTTHILLTTIQSVYQVLGDNGYWIISSNSTRASWDLSVKL